MASEHLTDEEWRPVQWHESAYQVSSLGRVRSLSRFRRGRGGHPVRVNARLLKQAVAGAGYSTVCLGAGSSVMVHRLVAIAFIPNPDGMPEVNHKDGNKKNNRVGNLEWVSHAGNGRHAAKNGLLAIGSRHGQSVLIEAQIPVIRQRVAGGESIRSVARELSVGSETVRAVITGRTWGHVK